MGKLIALLGAVAIICFQSSQIHKWHLQSDGNAQKADRIQATLDVTVSNYRAAAAKALADDKANAERVKAEADKISKERSDEYQKRIADARARAERLRAQNHAAPTDPCGAAAKGVSGVPNAASGADEAACKDRLPPSDQLLATEQAIQLDELIKWVAKVVGIDAHKTADELLK